MLTEAEESYAMVSGNELAKEAAKHVTKLSRRWWCWRNNKRVFDKYWKINENRAINTKEEIMLARERQNKIVEMVNANGSVLVKELSEMFEVTER